MTTPPRSLTGKDDPEYHRAVDPDDTLAMLEPISDEIGVLKIRDLTGFDRVGIPCMAAYRKRVTRSGFPFLLGAAPDEKHARIAAIMGVVERFSAELRGDPLELAAYETLGIHRALDPETLILPRPLSLGEELHWLEADDLLDGSRVFIPGNAVFCPYDSRGIATQLFSSDTLGLAAGMVRDEAILYSLLEVIEADALSRAERGREPGLMLDAEGSAAEELLSRFTRQDIDIHLWILPGRTRIPTVVAAADDRRLEDPGLLVVGSAAHPDPAFATMRALSEVAQRRCVRLGGEFENPERTAFLERTGYERMKRINRQWYLADRDTVALGSLPDMSTPSIDGDLKLVLGELRQQAERVLVADLTRTAIPVVRGVIPGFEVSCRNKERIRRHG
ncbi:ribosomal protein S12 methylthiotransferase accessory factor [Methanolinea mesophila]|uniref:YcaO-like family protein n=1 Tax=Methanolinea mesophila TaxID=547055 RepID=UPI001AE20CE8|nr:YcaO-like family protein [Methanolinea mesophila]MBP1928633.1 ribosomal protein S12 methylthiotransferase accessory factor [Methanolinea mesophila]